MAGIAKQEMAADVRAPWPQIGAELLEWSARAAKVSAGRPAPNATAVILAAFEDGRPEDDTHTTDETEAAEEEAVENAEAVSKGQASAAEAAEAPEAEAPEATAGV